MPKLAMWSMFWWISEELNDHMREKKRNSLGYNNPVQYWTWKLLTGWWDSGECQSWEKWAQLDCTLKDSCQPLQYEVPILQRVRHHNMEVLPHVKCSWRKAGWKFENIWKLCKIYKSKIILSLFSVNYSQGLRKSVVNWFWLWEVKHH
jgi:hypothetical protein